ncbi:MAG: MBL fold metallo-hydrolase [Anaerolineae bacterium]|nr:MBL fold metallo-hydrolase [Anaerolineae bacterium]MDW8102841.1 MBL fold metallo-hydrolase [Anaerolineae bacterium]
MSSQRLLILGTGASLSSRERDNTSLAFDTPSGILLIDCASNPYRQLLMAGLDPNRLFAIFLTHQHPDHVYGFPSLVHHFIMARRSSTLAVYANFPTLRTAAALLNAFGLRADFLRFFKVSEEKNYTLFEAEDFTLVTTPVRHVVPTLALRVNSRLSSSSFVYSADTGPCPELVALAKEADILIHECSVSRPSQGHTTPAQAAQLAEECGVKKLILIHFWPTMEMEKVYEEASQHFKGEIILARDFLEVEL